MIIYYRENRTESQNHSIVAVYGDLSRVCCPALLLIREVTQDRVWTASEYISTDGDHRFPGHPMPVLSHLDSEKVFPGVQWELPMFQLVPIASAPVTGPGSIFFSHYLQVRSAPQAFFTE